MATAEAHLGGVLPLDAHGEGHGEEEDAADAVEGQVGVVHQAAQPGGVKAKADWEQQICLAWKTTPQSRIEREGGEQERNTGMSPTTTNTALTCTTHK